MHCVVRPGLNNVNSINQTSRPAAGNVIRAGTINTTTKSTHNGTAHQRKTNLKRCPTRRNTAICVDCLRCKQPHARTHDMTENYEAAMATSALKRPDVEAASAALLSHLRRTRGSWRAAPAATPRPNVSSQCSSDVSCDSKIKKHVYHIQDAPWKHTVPPGAARHWNLCRARCSSVLLMNPLPLAT